MLGSVIYLANSANYDLDRTLGDTQDPVSDTCLVAPSTVWIEKPSFVKGIPAGLESDTEVQSRLDDLSPEEEAFSDHFSDEDYPALEGPHLMEEEDELIERYVRTCSTRPSTYLADKIAPSQEGK